MVGYAELIIADVWVEFEALYGSQKQNCYMILS